MTSLESPKICKLLYPFIHSHLQQCPKSDEFSSVVSASPWRIPDMNKMILFHKKNNPYPAYRRMDKMILFHKKNNPYSAYRRMALAGPIRKTPRDVKIQIGHWRHPRVFDLELCYKFLGQIQNISCCDLGGNILISEYDRVAGPPYTWNQNTRKPFKRFYLFVHQPVI